MHPFGDGNGRVGRLLPPLMMAAEQQVPLSPCIEVNKMDYGAALKSARRQLDRNAVIGFVAKAVMGIVDALKATRDALTELRRAQQGRGKSLVQLGGRRTLSISSALSRADERGLKQPLKKGSPPELIGTF